MIPYTRKIDREYNRILLSGSTSGYDQQGEVDVQVNPFNVQLAHDYLVKILHGLNDEELDNLPIEEYKRLLGEVMKAKDFLSQDSGPNPSE